MGQQLLHFPYYFFQPKTVHESLLCPNYRARCRGKVLTQMSQDSRRSYPVACLMEDGCGSFNIRDMRRSRGMSRSRGCIQKPGQDQNPLLSLEPHCFLLEPQQWSFKKLHLPRFLYQGSVATRTLESEITGCRCQRCHPLAVFRVIIAPWKSSVVLVSSCPLVQGVHKCGSLSFTVFPRRWWCQWDGKSHLERVAFGWIEAPEREFRDGESQDRGTFCQSKKEIKLTGFHHWTLQKRPREEARGLRTCFLRRPYLPSRGRLAGIIGWWK